MNSPLALSDPQFALGLDGANKVPHQYRSRFLDNVVDRLLQRDPLTTDDVESAVAATLSRMGVK